MDKSVKIKMAALAGLFLAFGCGYGTKAWIDHEQKPSLSAVFWSDSLFAAVWVAFNSNF